MRRKSAVIPAEAGISLINIQLVILNEVKNPEIIVNG